MVIPYMVMKFQHFVFFWTFWDIVDLSSAALACIKVTRCLALIIVSSWLFYQLHFSTCPWWCITISSHCLLFNWWSYIRKICHQYWFILKRKYKTCSSYTLSHPKYDRDVTERSQRYTLQDASFVRQSRCSFFKSRVRKHISCARDNKRLPPEYALTSRSFSRRNKV